MKCGEAAGSVLRTCVIEFPRKNGLTWRWESSKGVSHFRAEGEFSCHLQRSSEPLSSQHCPGLLVKGLTTQEVRVQPSALQHTPLPELMASEHLHLPSPSAVRFWLLAKCSQQSGELVVRNPD